MTSSFCNHSNLFLLSRNQLKDLITLSCLPICLLNLFLLSSHDYTLKNSNRQSVFTYQKCWILSFHLFLIGTVFFHALKMFGFVSLLPGLLKLERFAYLRSSTFMIKSFIFSSKMMTIELFHHLLESYAFPMSIAAFNMTIILILAISILTFQDHLFFWGPFRI